MPPANKHITFHLCKLLLAQTDHFNEIVLFLQHTMTLTLADLLGFAWKETQLQLVLRLTFNSLVFDTAEVHQTFCKILTELNQMAEALLIDYSFQPEPEFLQAFVVVGRVSC